MNGSEYSSALREFKLETDNDGVIKPTSVAISIAEDIIKLSIENGFVISLLGPTSDEGIFMEVSKENNTLVFDIYGDGEIIFIDKAKDSRRAEKIDISLAQYIIVNIGN